MKTIKKWLMILSAIIAISVTNIPLSQAEPITGESISANSSGFVGVDDNDEGYDEWADNANGDAYLDLISIITWVAVKASVLIGVVLVLNAFMDMRLSTEVGGHEKPKLVRKAMVGFLIGVLLLNITSIIDVVVHTLNPESKGGCLITNAEALDEIRVGKNKDACWSLASAQITGPTYEKAKSMIDSQYAGGIESQLKIVISTLQALGVIYFIIGINELNQISKGSSRHGVGRVLTQIIAAGLIIDFPHTVAVVQASGKLLGLDI